MKNEELEAIRRHLISYKLAFDPLLDLPADRLTEKKGIMLAYWFLQIER